MEHSFNHFASLDEFLSEVVKTPRKLRRSSDGHKGDSWSGGATSVAEAVRLPIEGNEMKRLEAEVGKLYSQPHKALEPLFSVTGSDIDMGRLMTGEPECMIDFDMTNSKVRFVHLVVGMTEGSMTGSKQIMHRAAAISSIIDNLENQNFRVRISLAIANMEGFKGISHNLTVVDIKDYYQPMSISNLSGLLHPSFYRRAIFCYWEGHQGWGKYSNYGSPPKNDNSGMMLADHIELLDTDKMLYLPSISEGSRAAEITSGFNRIEDANEYVKQVVEHIDQLS